MVLWFMSNAIEIENLSAGYHGVPVIRELSLSVPEGQMASVLGPNGAGKTTLVRCVTGLCRPLAGSIRLFGLDATAINAPERSRLVAVVPQELETAVSFTVQEIVMIGRTASLSRWTSPSKQDRASVERAMAYTDVVDMRNRPFNELSGGEKQRTVVAMALAQEPRLILMDEATSHLDMNHRLEVMQIVERLNREQGMTVLMISHDLNLASEFCRRLVLMDRGRLAADGTPAQVLTEETLRRVYHCDVRVQQSQTTGSVIVVPAPRLQPGCSGRGIRVHVIAGGGTGEEILRRLCLCDYTVTCGVLNRGDSDADVAEALGIDAVLEKPFSPVGESAVQKAREMIKAADVVVVSGVPIGPGNLANLDLALAAAADRKKVFIMDGISDRDYTTDRKAVAVVAQLKKQGAVLWRNITDLFGMLPMNRPS